MQSCINFSSDDSSYSMVACKWTMAPIWKESRLKKGAIRLLRNRIYPTECVGEEEGEVQYVFFMWASVCPLPDTV